MICGWSINKGTQYNGNSSIFFNNPLILNSSPGRFSRLTREHFDIHEYFFYLCDRERGCIYMIIVNVKENESIEKALKRFKKKFDRTGAIRELRARQYFEKPSIRRRGEVIKAAYKQRLQDEEGK